MRDQNKRLKTEGWVHFLGKLVFNNRKFFVNCGNIETSFLSESLSGVTVDRPVYITGLARSGSTLLLEILANHRKFAHHRYRDFPMIYTPYFWNFFIRTAAKSVQPPRERAHRDRIFVTADSPEAMEEPLWITFFPNCHSEEQSHVLDSGYANVQFEKFYAAHIRKLLLYQGHSRYLAKANYNIVRIRYLLHLFPNAKFIVPIRSPISQTLSLIKQHKLFCQGQEQNPRALTHMQRVGHFEFGLDRKIINVGDYGVVQTIRRYWSEGREIEAYATIWNSVYGYVYDTISADENLRSSVHFVRYEDLCKRPKSIIRGICDHVEIEVSKCVLERYASTISLPSYYATNLSEADAEKVRSITKKVASPFGYA